MGKDEELANLVNNALAGRVSRRDLMRRAAGLGLSAPVVAALLAACGGDDEAQQTPGTSGGGSGAGAATSAAPSGATGATSTQAGAGSPVAAKGTPGGTLKVALVGEPPTIDVHQTTGTIVGLIAWNMVETLFAWDNDFQLTPMLAESLDLSADKLTYTLKLRQGVPFHNGDEMKAPDVIASIQRWGGISGLGKGLLAATENVNAADDHTVVFKMKQPYGSFMASLALINQGCAIYPKSLIDSAGKDHVKEPIGTGPYKFVERQPDRLTRVERFSDYAALPGEANGYGGHKYAYADRMDFVPVPDEAARIAGLRAGDYDYPESLSPDQYESLKSDPALVAEILPPLSWGVFLLNMKQGPMANLKLRQAFQASLNHEPIAVAGYGQGFYRLNSSVMQQETPWYTEAGKELYNRNDPATARKLLQEAGYDGTPIRLTCTQQYQDHYNRSVVAKQQAEAAGMKIELLVYDWATVLSQQQQPDKWDITTTGITFRPDPVQLSIMDVGNFAGWWSTESTLNLVQQLRTEAEFDTRYGIWEKIQQNFYTEVPMIKVADALQLNVRAKRLEGLSPQKQLGPILWNCWLKR